MSHAPIPVNRPINREAVATNIQPQEADAAPDLAITACPGWYFGYDSFSSKMHGYPLADSMRACWFVNAPNVCLGTQIDFGLVLEPTGLQPRIGQVRVRKREWDILIGQTAQTVFPLGDQDGVGAPIGTTPPPAVPISSSCRHPVLQQLREHRS